MQTPLVQAFALMLPRLQAEESLRFITAIAVGGGHLKRQESRRVLRQLTRQVGRTESTSRITTAKDIGFALESVGLSRG